jgi:hypothetical protein
MKYNVTVDGQVEVFELPVFGEWAGLVSTAQVAVDTQGLDARVRTASAGWTLVLDGADAEAAAPVVVAAIEELGRATACPVCGQPFGDAATHLAQAHTTQVWRGRNDPPPLTGYDFITSWHSPAHDVTYCTAWVVPIGVSFKMRQRLAEARASVNRERLM